MKLTSKYIKQLIREAITSRDASKEKYFGPDPEALPCFERTADGKLAWADFLITGEEYICMEKHGYHNLGEGSFRTVYEVPGNDDIVLKIAYDGEGEFRTTGEDEDGQEARQEIDRAREMNRKEAEGSYQTDSPLVTKVFEASDDYFWIKSEKVEVLRYWEDIERMTSFRDIAQSTGLAAEIDFRTGVTFAKVWGFMLHRKAEKMIQDRVGLVGSIFRTAQRAQNIPDHLQLDIVDFNHYIKSGWLTQKYLAAKENTDLFLETMVNDPLIKEVREHLARHKLPHGDIRPGNVGTVLRNGKKQFVILDPGFELDFLGFSREK